MRMVPLPIIHNDPLAKLLLPDPITLCSVNLKVLVSDGKVGVSSKKHNKYYIEMKVETFAWPLQSPDGPRQHAKKEDRELEN